MCYAHTMFETTQDFLEYWEVFLNNLDILNIDVSSLERSYKIDSDDYVANFDSEIAFEINQNREGQPSIRINESMIKFRIPVKYNLRNGSYPSMDILFYSEAISDQLKLIEYLSVNIPVFTNIFSTVVDLENKMIKNLKNSNNKYYINRENLNRFHICDLSKKMPFTTFDEAVVKSSYEDDSFAPNFQFFYGISSKSLQQKLRNLALIGFFNEDFGVDFYYHPSESFRLEPGEYKNFPLNLEECADEENTKKFIKAIKKVVDEINRI